MSTVRLFVPKQAVGASLVYFDLFNAVGSTISLYLLSVMPIVSGEVAVVSVLGPDLFLTRTTTVGTTGTAATQEGSSLTGATFTNMDGQGAPFNDSVTARLTPGGGATAGAVISVRSVCTEETNAGLYVPPLDMVKAGQGDEYIVIPQGTGIRVVQGSVASTGNIGFDVMFRTSPPSRVL